MAEAVRLGEESRGRSAPNPNVGCVIVSPGGKIVGRGATAAGGRPHAEAIALEAGRAAGKGRHRLCDARALRARQRARAGLRRTADQGEAGASRDRAQGPRSAHRGQGHQTSARRRDRREARGRARGGEAIARRLAHANASSAARASRSSSRCRSTARSRFRRANRNGSPARMRAATSISSAPAAT